MFHSRLYGCHYLYLTVFVTHLMWKQEVCDYV